MTEQRKSDRDRAALRRERQHGESEEAYRDRIRQRLEESTGVVVTVEHLSVSAGCSVYRSEYRVCGYANRETKPVIQVRRGTLSAAANAFEHAAAKARQAGIIR